ncbi:MAG TPA: hypothetical protein VF811_01190, partial [Parasulfuritortus sp.]
RRGRKNKPSAMQSDYDFATHCITNGFPLPFSRSRDFGAKPGVVGEHCLSPQGELRSRPASFRNLGVSTDVGRAFFG